MYSESDFDDQPVMWDDTDTPPEYKDAFGYRCIDEDGVLEAEGEKIHTRAREYAETVLAFLEDCFPDQIVQDNMLPDLSDILSPHNLVPNPFPVAAEGAATAAIPTSLSDVKPTEAETGDTPAPVKTTPSTETTEEVSELGIMQLGFVAKDVSESMKERLAKEYRRTHKHTIPTGPAYKFLSVNGLAASLLLPIAPGVNRKELREKHAKDFVDLLGADETVDFVVGYFNAEDTGLALVMTTHAEVLERLRSAYPAARPPTADDVVFFLKWKKQVATPTRQHNEAALLQAAASSGLLQFPAAAKDYMSSTAELLRCVEAAGGWGGVVFVCFDVEAAAVLPNAVPLPLEFGFCPLPLLSGAESEVPEQHWFCHPGSIASVDERTVYYNSCCTTRIPFGDVAFLDNDYAAAADYIQTNYLANPAVVLINDGTVMDLQALRWYFAASNTVCGTEYSIPGLSELRCFSFDALKALVASKPASLHDEGVLVPPPTQCQGPCMYHETLDNWCMDGYAEDGEEDTDGDSAQYHCAFRDAARLRESLANVFRAVVADSRSGPSEEKVTADIQIAN